MRVRSSDELIASACHGLMGPCFGLAEARAVVPDEAGLYAIYGEADTWGDLELGKPPDGRPLYVGKAEESLASRDLDTHFCAGRTGQSTVRRTFSALLRDRLGLRGIPRNLKRPERLANYALSAEHDAALDAWMSGRLQLAFWLKPKDCEILSAVEVGVLTCWKPPLNLKNNQSAWRAQVEAARRVMTEDARAWCAERRLSVGTGKRARRPEMDPRR